jgi:glycosyltransferase involved in cell wall biosynthesis
MTTSHPPVSVLVTVYNRAKYLSACLDSILASTWQDFEIIIVDDCSSDDSFEIAKSYAAGDRRIRLYQNDRNLGDYDNRNRTAALARGKYLKYLDADDLIYSHGLSVMVEALEQYPEAAFGLSHTDRNPSEPYPFCTNSETVFRDAFLGQGVLGRGPSSAIIRRDAFEEVGGFSGRRFVGDNELWFRLAARWPAVSLPPALVWWRRHEGQEFVEGLKSGAYLERWYDLAVETLKSPECPMSACDINAARSRVKQHHARRILALATRGRRPREAWRLFSSSGLTFSELTRGFRSYE